MLMHTWGAWGCRGRDVAIDQGRRGLRAKAVTPWGRRAVWLAVAGRLMPRHTDNRHWTLIAKQYQSSPALHPPG